MTPGVPGVEPNPLVMGATYPCLRYSGHARGSGHHAARRTVRVGRVWTVSDVTLVIQTYVFVWYNDLSFQWLIGTMTWLPSYPYGEMQILIGV